MKHSHLAIFSILMTTAFSAHAVGGIMTLMPNMDNIYLRSDGSSVALYTLTNGSTSSLSQITIDPAYGGGNAAHMSVHNDACSTVTLIPGGSCTFQVFISGESQPSNFILSPRACAFNGMVCSQASAANRPAVTVYQSTQPVTAYFALLSGANQNGVQPVTVSTQQLAPALSGFNFDPGYSFDLPVGLDFSPNGDMLFVPNVGDNSITVVNRSTLAQQVITVGLNPTSVAVTPDGAKAYVTNFGDGNLTSINLANYQTVTIPLAGFLGGAIDVAADATRVFISNVGGNEVYVVSTALDAVIHTISQADGDFTTPEFIVVSPDNTKLYITNFNGSTVSVIDLVTYLNIHSIPVGTNPAGITISPDGQTIYVGNTMDNTISVINTATYATQTISMGASPGGLDVTPDGAQLYVGHTSDESVTIFNTSDFSDTTVIDIGGVQFSLGNFLG